MDKLSTFKIGNLDANIYVGETLLNRYTPLEYISSTLTGGLYIDLGCKLMENTDDIEIDIKFIINDYYLPSYVNPYTGNGWYQSTKTSSGLATLLNGIKEDNSSWPGFVLRRDSNSGAGYKTRIYLYAKWNFTNSSVANNKYYANNLGGGNAETELTTNEVLYEKHFLLNNIPQSQCHNVSTTLFCSYLENENKYDRFIIADLYYLKIKKGGLIIRDLVPVYDKITLEPGLYDKLNDVFYKSLGDEPFAAPS